MRYGEELYMPTIEETYKAVELAERVKAFVLQRLHTLGLEP